MSKKQDFERIRLLTQRLNTYRDEYYNKNAPTVSDAVYDRLFDELLDLEEQTGCCMGSSPTQTVGYAAVSSLEKTEHKIPLLSLEKTKNIPDLISFIGKQPVNIMLKLDGLTVKLTYENGKLIEAATRGNGTEGEIITHNARTFLNLPVHIPYKDRLVITGEAFIYKKDFDELKERLLDSSGNPYRNSRNLAAGSVRLLDAAACRERRISFLPFNVLEGFANIENADSKSARLQALEDLGFSCCAFCYMSDADTALLERHIEELKSFAEKNGIPIDGIVVGYDSVSYSKTCGRTGHHYKDGIAFKFADDFYETRLREIEWTPARSGEISPVAIFDTVEIDGCEVSRASLHNLTFIENLALTIGGRILVSKRNMIIPHVEGNLDTEGFDLQSLLPKVCPCCGEPTRIHTSETSNQDRVTKTLFCDNPACEMQRLRRFVHFVSKKAMDIEGLSEATLERLIANGYLHSFTDLYRLDRYCDDIIAMDGFGEKSWQRLWDAIERSRNTTFERYLISMDIPMVGNNAGRELSRTFNGSLDAFLSAVNEGFDFTQLPDFGQTLHNNIHNWFKNEENFNLWEELQTMVKIENKNTNTMTQEGKENPFVGCTIVVTGKVEPYTRDGINAKIESLGAHAGKSVSKNTDYLVCGERAGSKLAKAQALGVTVLSPAEFFRMAGE